MKIIVKIIMEFDFPEVFESAQSGIIVEMGKI